MLHVLIFLWIGNWPLFSNFHFPTSFRCYPFFIFSISFSLWTWTQFIKIQIYELKFIGLLKRWTFPFSYCLRRKPQELAFFFSVQLNIIISFKLLFLLFITFDCIVLWMVELLAIGQQLQLWIEITQSLRLEVQINL